MNKDMVIALDGPSGSGKSTVAKRVAEKLGLIYIDTGSMFRAAAYALQHTGIDFTAPKLDLVSENKVRDFLEHHRFQYSPFPGVLIMLDNLNLTDAIREHNVSRLASQISKHKVIRDFLAKWQREIVCDRPSILDGRDIGTVIFPNAILKIFLTASAEERAQRRYDELKERGQADLDFKTILKDIEERDYEDMNRDLAPLKKAPDAIELDSTGKTVDQMVEFIIKKWIEHKGKV